MIRKIFNRHPEGLVATCEICGVRGASAYVPYRVEHWPIEQSGEGGKIAFRCGEHSPDPTNDDLSQVEVDMRFAV